MLGTMAYIHLFLSLHTPRILFMVALDLDRHNKIPKKTCKKAQKKHMHSRGSNIRKKKKRTLDMGTCPKKSKHPLEKWTLLEDQELFTMHKDFYRCTSSLRKKEKWVRSLYKASVSVGFIKMSYTFIKVSHQ